MTEPTNKPAPSGEHRLLRWVLVLQVVILAWLAKNHFDGAFHRSSHNQPTAVATSTDTPPSLESSAHPNAPSSFPLPSRLSLFGRPPPPPRRMSHPSDHLRAEMERMLSEANRAFADFDSFFGMDEAWSALPASPALNMRETDEAYELTLAMPDADPNAFDVRLDGRLLSISSHQDTRTPRSSSSQHFSSRLLLPGPVEANTLMQITNETDRVRIRIPKAGTASVAAAASR